MKIVSYLFSIIVLFSIIACHSDEDPSIDENTGTIIDNEGNTYTTVKIGTQWWMSENLKTTKYNDGIKIPNVADRTEWMNLTTPGFTWYDNDMATYDDTYGVLYNWEVVNTGKLCPAGWHVSTDDEWTSLSDYLGGEHVAGGKLKEVDTTMWFSPNTGATNESGFRGLPGGGREWSADFANMRWFGFWWTSTELNTEKAWYRDLNYKLSSIQRYTYFKASGFSVRCVKD